MDYDEEDKLDTPRFNRELWKGIMGALPYPAARLRAATCLHLDSTGKTDLVVWRPSNGNWYELLSSRNYNTGSVLVQQLGTLGNIPVPGHYNVVGTTVPAVWAPSTGNWTVFNKGTFQWGALDDYPQEESLALELSEG